MGSECKYNQNNRIDIKLLCAPVWARSPNAQKLNTELNSASKAVMGCLKPTNVEESYLLAGISPPDIRRDLCARIEKTKQETNEAHCLYGQHPAERMLKSRNCFLRSAKPGEITNNTTQSYCQPKRNPSKRI